MYFTHTDICNFKNTFKNNPMFRPVSLENVKDESFIVQAPKCVVVPLLPVVLLNIFERDDKMCDIFRIYRRANFLIFPLIWLCNVHFYMLDHH